MERVTTVTIRDEWQIKLHACMHAVNDIVQLVQQRIEPERLPKLAKAYLADAILLKQQINRLSEELALLDDQVYSHQGKLIQERFTYNRKIRSIEKNVFMVRYQLLQVVEKLLPLT